MKIFDIPDAGGEPYAFEVSNLLLGRRRACQIVMRIPRVRIVSRPRLFSWWREDVFCAFELGGVPFRIEEPFGDNSRYWIGPSNGTTASELRVIREAFRRARLGAFCQRANLACSSRRSFDCFGHTALMEPSRHSNRTGAVARRFWFPGFEASSPRPTARSRGQGIARVTQHRSGDTLLVDHGSLYPALLRLEKDPTDF